jgi:hypothetical protein
MRIPALVAAALLLAAPAAAQQPSSDGLTGTRVRVTAPHFLPAPLQGTVVSYTQAGLGVTADSTADTVMLPLRAISRLDRFAGGSAGSTAWYRGRLGAFIGAGLGLVAGPLLAKVTDQGMGESALIGGVAGLGTGFVIGAAWGASAPRERWTWVVQPWGYDPTLRPAQP